MIFHALSSLAARTLCVAAGAALGGAARYLVSAFLPWRGGFPWGTWSVNVAGSLVLGLVSGLLARQTASNGVEALRAFAVAGLCGGFTTFSTFSNETFRLLENSQWGLAALYAASSLAAGLLAVFLGYALAHHL